MNAAPVVMYARSGCGYCRRARELLNRKGVAYTEIDTGVSGARLEMERRSGRNTVPQIFVGDQHLGGYDDIDALDVRGELDAILAGADLSVTGTENHREVDEHGR